MVPNQLRISTAHKTAFIIIGAFEVVFGMVAIACSISTIVFTLYSYRGCSYGYCDFYDWLYRFSVTSQGIWTGCFVIISAGLNFCLVKNTTKQMASISAGFSLLAFILTIAMIILESLAVADYYNDYEIWALHCSLLATGCCLFGLTLTTVILSFLLTGCSGCVCCQSSTVLPITSYGINQQMAESQLQTVSSQIPFNNRNVYITSGPPVGEQVSRIQSPIAGPGQQQAISPLVRESTQFSNPSRQLTHPNVPLLPLAQQTTQVQFPTFSSENQKHVLPPERENTQLAHLSPQTDTSIQANQPHQSVSPQYPSLGVAIRGNFSQNLPQKDASTMESSPALTTQPAFN